MHKDSGYVWKAVVTEALRQACIGSLVPEPKEPRCLDQNQGNLQLGQYPGYFLLPKQYLPETKSDFIVFCCILYGIRLPRKCLLVKNPYRCLHGAKTQTEKVVKQFNASEKQTMHAKSVLPI